MSGLAPKKYFGFFTHYRVQNMYGVTLEECYFKKQAYDVFWRWLGRGGTYFLQYEAEYGNWFELCRMTLQINHDDPEPGLVRGWNPHNILPPYDTRLAVITETGRVGAGLFDGQWRDYETDGPLNVKYWANLPND